MKNELCRRAGIELPIFAFSHCRDVVAAVSRAGGIGVLGAAGFTPGQLRQELDWIQSRVGERPFGIDVIMPKKFEAGAVPDLQSMIPEGHRAWVESVLARYGIAPLPPPAATARRRTAASAASRSAGRTRSAAHCSRSPSATRGLS